MPNLKTDRAVELVAIGSTLNVRRLMYQTLIWPKLLRHSPGSLGAALDSEDLERAADALVNGVRGYAELDRDLLGRQMLVDQAQAIELAR